MHSAITWGQLLTYLSIFLLLYYTLLLLLFYRKDVLTILKTGKKPVTPKRDTLPASPASSAPGSKQDSNLYNTVHELMEDCKPVFHAAVAQQLEKEQVLEALQTRIQKYPQLKGTALQDAVTSHLEQELHDRCKMTLPEHELISLWQ